VSLARRVFTIVAGATCALSGCQIVQSDISTDVAPVAPAPEAVKEEFIPEFVEGGSALENQPYIDFVISQALDGQGSQRAGLGVVEALVAAGFSQEFMELTPDRSLIELPVDSTSVAIQIGEECVIGQWGTDWYVSAVEPVLATGTCLLGETISLD
jgi:hypothetical protein